MKLKSSDLFIISTMSASRVTTLHGKDTKHDKDTNFVGSGRTVGVDYRPLSWLLYF